MEQVILTLNFVFTEIYRKRLVTISVVTCLNFVSDIQQSILESSGDMQYGLWMNFNFL